MNLLYNTGIALMRAGMRVASLRSEKVKAMLAGQRATLSSLKAKRRHVAPDGFDVWFHAASLGEFEQGRPLIERLRRKHPDWKMLLTFFSPSGYRVRRKYDKVDAICYLPLDTPANVRKFLDAAAPKRAFFIKYEFWGNYLTELARRNIPTYLISAIFREGQNFFKPYGGMFRRILRCFTRLYVQDEASRSLLQSIGINNVTIAGDTRFDRVTDIRRAARELPAVITEFVDEASDLLVAGSSWQPDEEVYMRAWLDGDPSRRLIIAPHEWDEKRINALLDHDEYNPQLLSRLLKHELLTDDCRMIIVDSFGLLSSLYRVASIAWIGGGYGVGIHNINEAAVYGVPVLFGPRHDKFKEASDLITLGGGFEVADADAARALFDLLTTDTERYDKAAEAAGRYIADHVGATDIIYHDLFE